MSRTNPDTRTRILQAAWELLESAEAPETRMADIARRAGVSRQAVYLHFPTRAELLIATTHHIDAVKKADDRLAASRTAATGPERLDAFIEAWGNYIPEIYGVGRALMAMSTTDEAARLAWDDRMQAVRHGCRAAVEALARDGRLATEHSAEEATDLLWTLLSVPGWERLRLVCGWPQARYVEKMKALARRALVAAQPGDGHP
ncbi:MAG TPA: TetR/AcrR family transcriptional regulator [Thermohalobaculum sp.]|nr:TetR/AcrR family transcriptional regulator [Thermohalobaculum sp.]